VTQQPRPRTQRSLKKKGNYQQIFIPHTGRIRRHAHKLEDVLDLRIIAYQGTGAHGIEDTTYLAIGVGCSIQTGELKYDEQESRQTRNGIDLQGPIRSELWVGEGNRIVNASLRTHIVQRYGRCPRMTFHSKSRVVMNSQLEAKGRVIVVRYVCERRALAAGRRAHI